MSTKKIVIYSMMAAFPVLLYFLVPSPEVLHFNTEEAAIKQDMPIPASTKVFGTDKIKAPLTSKQIQGVQGADEPVQKPNVISAPMPRNSMEKARLYGDPRTPPIERSKTIREMPTEDELANPELYQEYEARQNKKVYQSFYKESKKKLSQMEELMEKGRLGGVSEEQLREGEEKIEAMKAMRKQLEEEHDDLSD